MKQWEYDNVYVGDEEVAQTLVKLDLAGKDGWEFTGHTNDTGYGTTYLMKRQYEHIEEVGPALQTPEEWCAELGATVVDSDGWRDGTRKWTDAITREEFDKRLLRCTIDGRGYPSFIKPGTKL